MAGICKNCGAKTMKGQEICWDCGRKQKAEREANMAQHNRGSRSGGGHRGHGGNRSKKQYYLDTFLTEDGFIRPEVFKDMPNVAKSAFSQGHKKLTQSQIRTAFHQLKSFSNRMKVDENIAINEMIEVYLRLYRWAKYQVNRGAIPRQFLDFVHYHTEVATKTKQEFNGFVEYLTSILVELRAR